MKNPVKLTSTTPIVRTSITRSPWRSGFLLLALALVGTLAMSAFANPRTASQVYGAGNIQHSKIPFHVLAPDSTYMIDDGTAENNLGVGFKGGDLIVLNEFAVIPGSETINSVSIAWGSPVFPDPSLNGLPYTVALWSDPNGDGDPTDAVLLTTSSGVVAMQGTNTFLPKLITPTTITTPNFFVGFLIQNTNGDQFPAAFDQTNPISDRSYAADGPAGTGNIENLNDNKESVATVESFGFPGNFLIRADVNGDLGLVSAASRKTHGTKGDFDIDLPLTGDLGIECRSGLTRYTTVFTFNSDMAGADSATSTCGTVSSIALDPANSQNLLVSFNGATCNGQVVTVTVTNAHDILGNTLASTSASMGLLVGDVTGDGRVVNGDIAAVQAVQGQQTNSSNFRNDVTLDGRINNQDVQTVRSHRGEVLSQ